MKDKLLYFTLLLAATFFLLFPAFINGYPIVYDDTSTYLASGFELEAPFDRPITYGLFVMGTSLYGSSLWFVIFCQALLVVFLLFQLVKTIFPTQKYLPVLGFFIVAQLALFTSLSWTLNQIIADIFTSIALLTAFLIVLNPSWQKKFLPYFLFFLATGMHMAHLSFNLVFLTSLLLISRIPWFSIKKAVPIRPILVLMGLTVASIVFMGAALSKSKHVFLMGALVEHGIAKTYLDEFCPEKNYQLCAYKDSLPPKAWQFIWEKDSPFYKIGSWKGTKKEFNSIISHTLTSPNYLGLHLQASIKATLEQLTKFKIGDGNSIFLEGTLLHTRMQQYFPSELNAYEHSLQSQGKLSFLTIYNSIQQAMVLISIVLLALLAIFTKTFKKHPTLALLGIMILLSIFVNAWACGTLANAIDRLGAKVIWLIPLLALLSLGAFMEGLFRQKIEQ